jgi:hypothetical protein
MIDIKKKSSAAAAVAAAAASVAGNIADNLCYCKQSKTHIKYNK